MNGCFWRTSIWTNWLNFYQNSLYRILKAHLQKTSDKMPRLRFKQDQQVKEYNSWTKNSKRCLF